MGSPSNGEHVATLARAFPRTPITPAVMDTYVAELADIPPMVLGLVVRELIRTEEWFPTIAKVREVAAARVLDLPTEPLALAQIEARMRWARQDEETRGEAPFVHPVAREVLNLIGGYHALKAAEDVTVVRGQFGRLYRDERARRLREAQVGDLTLEAGPQRRALGC